MSRLKKTINILDIVDFNNRLLLLLKNCQQEINYKISDSNDYPKNVQRLLIQNHPNFKELEDLFMDSQINTDQHLPFIFSNKTFSKITENFSAINSDVSLIFSQLKTVNFQLLFGLVKIVFNDLKKRRNNSLFYKRVCAILDENPANWDEISDPNIRFFLLNILVLSIDELKIIISEDDIKDRIESKSVFCLYNNKSTFTNDGIKNLNQQIFNLNEEVGIDTITFLKKDKPKSEYEIYSYIVFDSRVKKGEIEGFNVPRNYFERAFYSLFHQPTIHFLNERKHNYIYNNLYTYVNTFNIFLRNKIQPIDRLSFLLAGSVIKSAYNVRDCADVDFFVLDHEDNIEKYGKYKPNIGIPDIFDDFGKTYYANEEYYFPMIPAMYERQKTLKQSETRIEIGPKNIFNNYPKFSVSGLKAGRYVDIFSAECRKIGYDIENLDELVSNPGNRIYFLGCPVIQLKLEMIRDNIKDIDLGRVSRKQLHDLHFLKTNYDYLFNRTEVSEFGLDRFSESKDKMKKSKISLALNCYHKELVSETKVGYDLLIRRMPLYIEDITAKLIHEAPLLISRDNEIIHGDSRLTYQKPLLSSLPATILTPSGTGVLVNYYYELSDQGELKIFISQEETLVSLYSNVCITGNIRVETTEGNKKLSISVAGPKMRKIYSQIPSADKKYKNLLLNFMKNLIQMHKIVDCHTKEKVSIEILK